MNLTSVLFGAASHTFKGAGLCIAVAFAVGTAAHATTLDFESVGPVSGLDATAYFAGYGITLTPLTGPGSPPAVFIYSNPPNIGFATTSGTNFIEQFATGSPPNSFQLSATTPGTGASFVSFWRTGFRGGYLPQFSATFYEGAAALGSVNGNQEFSPPPEFFSFTAPIGHMITSVIIASDGHGFTGVGSTPIDDISFTPTATPLPAALPLFATGLGMMGLLGWRRKRKAASETSI